MRLEASSRDLPALLRPLGAAAQTTALFPDAGLPSPADRPRRVRLSSPWLPSACPRRAAGHGALAASAPSCAPGDELARDMRPRPSRTRTAPKEGIRPALVPPRILEVASTSTYASLVHSSVGSNRKEGAARRPVGKLTRSQGDGHGLCLRGVGECRHLPGPLGLAVPASWWGSEGSLWGVQWGLGASVPQARWGCCYRGDKAFRPGNMAKPDREREPDRRTGLQGPHSSTAPSSDTAQHSTGRSPSLPRPPPPGAQPPLGPASEKGRRPIQGG